MNMLDKAEAMKLRTKQFAIVLSASRGHYLALVRATLSVNNCFAAARQLRLIIGRFVGYGPTPSLFPR
jgi:hypothetical protein